MDPIKDEEGKPIDLGDLVKEASASIMRERRADASNLIKNFLVKAEQVTEQLKTKRMEVTKLEEALAHTLDKIKKLREGDWSVLKDNKGKTQPDSSQKKPDSSEE